MALCYIDLNIDLSDNVFLQSVIMVYIWMDLLNMPTPYYSLIILSM